MTQVLPDKVKEQVLNAIPLKRFGEPIDIANTVFLAVKNLDISQDKQL